jgi:hypothetical protein
MSAAFSDALAVHKIDFTISGPGWNHRPNSLSRHNAPLSTNFALTELTNRLNITNEFVLNRGGGEMADWIVSHHVGDFASIAGIFITVIGFLSP